MGLGAYYTGRQDLQLGLTYYALFGLPRLKAIDAVPTDPVRESMTQPSSKCSLSICIIFGKPFLGSTPCWRVRGAYVA